MYLEVLYGRTTSIDAPEMMGLVRETEQRFIPSKEKYFKAYKELYEEGYAATVNAFRNQWGWFIH